MQTRDSDIANHTGWKMRQGKANAVDYIYQLRGMTWVRIRKAQGPIARQKIRDWSAVDDINAVVTLPKEPDYAFASELDNLAPIAGLSNFVPTDDDKHIVRRWYADDDPIREILGMDDDGDTISVVSSDARSTPSPSDFSDDEGPDDDDEPNTPSLDGEGDNDSGVNVDINDDLNDSGIDVDMDDDNDNRDNTQSDASSTLGDDGNDREDPEDDTALDGINDGLDQIDMGDESESVDEDAADDNTDNISTTTISSGDSNNSSRPNNTGHTGITSDYLLAVSAANLSQGSRRRSNTVSSSTANAGNDAGDLDIIDDDKDDGNTSDSDNDNNDGEEEKNNDGDEDNNTKDDAGSDSSSIFVT
ncbi:hypothetical protein PG993_004532 [Apiospora rasikravindrae]|uniref:Uncharacterized protein n=1 Tax=Apiospora rasikravindrae TaxID=990691 RepID=A0ABR1TFR8_9PEZI